MLLRSYVELEPCHLVQYLFTLGYVTACSLEFHHMLYYKYLFTICVTWFTALRSPWKQTTRLVNYYSEEICSTITGLAVALTCYISHSAKHWKMADFDPSGSQNP